MSSINNYKPLKSTELLILIFCFINFITGELFRGFEHREKRQLGGMYSGGPGMNMGQGGGIQGIQNFQAGDGIRNPERPQLESIYRGKVIWGNVSENQINREEDRLINNRRPVQPGLDPYGNPIEPSPDEIRRARPRVKPKRKDKDFLGLRQKRDIDERKFENYKQKGSIENEKHHIEHGRERRDIELANESNLVHKEQNIKIDNEKQKENIENERQKRDIAHERNLGNDLQNMNEQGNEIKDEADIVKIENERQQRDLENMKNDNIMPNFVGCRIGSEYKGPKIESIYVGPKIESIHKGPQILSIYTGAPIKSLYEGPIIKSQYNGPEIESIYGHIKDNGKVKNEQVSALKMIPENIAMKYERMNEENNMIPKPIFIKKAHALKRI